MVMGYGGNIGTGNRRPTKTTSNRGNSNRGNRVQGACGGTPRRDGSGGGKGNRGTSRQPSK